jgi:hypothetical protein
MVNRKPTFVVAEAAIDTSPKTEIAIEQFVITPLPVKKRAFRALHISMCQYALINKLILWKWAKSGAES